LKAKVDASLSQWLKNQLGRWGVLVQGSVWVLGTVGAFLLPPPIGLIGGDEKGLAKVAQFIISVVLGLAFVAGRRWKNRKHLARWSLASAGLLVVSICCFLAYQYLLYSFTCKYNGQAVIIGTSYTQQGAYYTHENPGEACDDLLDDFAGRAEDIWTKDSITRCRLALAFTYILCIPVFTISMIAVVQAIYILKPRRASARRPRPDNVRSDASPQSKQERTKPSTNQIGKQSD
jgi:amino acid transporter